jgi:hypothetical protein
MATTTSRQIRLTIPGRLEDGLQFALAHGSAPSWLRPVEPVFQSPSPPDSLPTARAADGRCRRAFELLDTTPQEVTSWLEDHQPSDDDSAVSQFEGFRVVVDFSDGAIDDVAVVATYRSRHADEVRQPSP